MRGYLIEGGEWLRRLLAQAKDGSGPFKAKALCLAARLAGLPGETSLARLAALAASADWQAAGPVIDPHPPCQEVAETELTRWPLLKSWPNDGLPDHGGRFLTLPLVITRDPVTGQKNCGMYRAALLGPDRLVIHWGEESGAAAHARAWAARGEAMPVAIALGGDPAVTFAATLPLPAALDEFTFAGLLRSEPVSLARCRSVDLLVPAGAELVIEGTVQPGEKAGSGAFGNHTGSSVPGVAMPVLRVTTITRRQQPIYPATVVGPPPVEDQWLGKATERLFLPMLQMIFPEIVDISFTAHMEDDLDRVASGDMQWTSAIREFYEPFKDQVEKAQAEMPVSKSGPEPIGRKCPEDGGELVIRYGRYGKFISCSNFPACRYTEPWLEKIGVKCPKDGGELVERKTRKGRTFYGCANYPACDFTSWKRPLAQPCPKCGGLLVVANKREAQCTNCQETFLLENIVPEAAHEP